MDAWLFCDYGLADRLAALNRKGGRRYATLYSFLCSCVWCLTLWEVSLVLLCSGIKPLKLQLRTALLPSQAMIYAYENETPILPLL
jgi:hypothetical protein